VTLKGAARIAQQNLYVKWHTPEGWAVSPSREGYRLLSPDHTTARLDYTLTPSAVAESSLRLVLEIRWEGRAAVYLVPVTFLNGTLY